MGTQLHQSGVLICLGVGLEEFSAARSDDRRTRQGQCCRPRLREGCATACKTKLAKTKQKKNREPEKLAKTKQKGQNISGTEETVSTKIRRLSPKKSDLEEIS